MNHRQFDSGATRDTSNGKLEYGNYIHPLNDYSFSMYMKSKTIIDGKYRRGDNRQKGIPYNSLFDSLIRHIEILKLLKKGYRVFEDKVDGKVALYVFDCNPPNDRMEEKTIESELNAIRFNSEGMKLQYITNNIIS